MAGTEKKNRAVVIEPLYRWRPKKFNAEQREELQRKYPDIELIFDENIPVLPNLDTAESAELEEYANVYSDLVKAVKPELILSSTFDNSALIHSYVAHNNKYLKAPSVEAVVLCNAKGYTRKMVIPDQYNPRYAFVPLYPGKEVDIDKIIDTVGFPLILKPPCDTNSCLVQKCVNREELVQAVKKVAAPEVNLRSYFDIWGKLLVGLEEKYELLKVPHLIAEECIGIDSGEATIHTVEVCIQDGRVIQCEIADNLYWENHPQVFLACAVPSSLPEATLQAAYKMREEVAQKLISFGMDNCFFNIEVFGMKDGSVKVLEINSRMASQYQQLVQMMYNQDKMGAFIDLQLGKHVPTPQFSFLTDPSAPKFGVNFYLVSVETGAATDIFDFEYFDQLIAEKRADIGYYLTMDPKRYLAIQTNSGTNFGFANICGDDYEDCKRKLKPIYHKLFKNSNKFSLWEDKKEQ